MLCARCGTQVEPLDNFCKNCGAALKKSAGSSSFDKRSAKIQLTPAEQAENANIVSADFKKNTRIPPTVTIGLMLTVIIAGAGLYFGTNLLRQSARQRLIIAESSVSREPMQAGHAAPSQPDEQNLPATVESSNLRPDALPKPAPSAVVSTTPHTPPQPAAAQKSASGDKTPAPASSTSRRSRSSGMYETTRSTPLFELPSADSRLVANIPGGMRVTVVSSKGDWLEVRSRRGKPPGFIRRQDANFIERGDQ